MQSKTLSIIVIILLTVVIVFLYFQERQSPPLIIDNTDTLYIVRDSINREIDTINTIIEKVQIKYETDRNTIINNNTSDDYLFFLQYINNNSARLDSINNSTATEVY